MDIKLVTIDRRTLSVRSLECDNMLAMFIGCKFKGDDNILTEVCEQQVNILKSSRTLIFLQFSYILATEGLSTPVIIGIVVGSIAGLVAIVSIITALVMLL